MSGEDFTRPDNKFNISKDQHNDNTVAPRARNRTVLLNSETTGKVRKQLEQELTSNTDGFSKVEKKEVATKEVLAIEHNPSLAQNVLHNAHDGFMSPGWSNNPLASQQQQQQFFNKNVNLEDPFENYGKENISPRTESSQREFSQQQDVTPEYSRNEALNNQNQVLYHQQQNNNFKQPKIEPKTEERDNDNCADYIRWVKNTPVIGFLVSYDKNEHGDYFPLRVGRLLVTSDASTAGVGNSFFALLDESVSVGHAILRFSPPQKQGCGSKNIEILDQLSESGTKILRLGEDGQQFLHELSGDKGLLQHGDRVIFGNRQFLLVLVPEIA